MPGEMAALLGNRPSPDSAPGTTSKRRLLDDSASSVGLSEQLQIAAGRLVYAPQCGAFYSSLLVASITEIVWISHPWLNPRHWCAPPRSHHRAVVRVWCVIVSDRLSICSRACTHSCKVFYPQSTAFFFVEAYLTLGLVAETTVTLLWQRGAFWSSGANWFDAIVCAMSVFSFALYWYGGEAVRAAQRQVHAVYRRPSRPHPRPRLRTCARAVCVFVCVSLCSASTSWCFWSWWHGWRCASRA